jgi:PTS system nitrogen regulatory IIA component
MSATLSLSQLVERGGVYYNIAGSSPSEALGAFIKGIDLPEGLDREEVLRAVLEREALMPTAIGRGIAIPHPRNPLISDEGEQRVSVAFLKTPVPYNALDRKPVSSLFLILSAGARSHLAILAELSHLGQRQDFIELLAKRPSTESLVEYIAGVESSWAK